MSATPPIPILYVEGKDDISVINALLSRHGMDTERGKRYLRIQDQENVETLLANMPEAIKNATDRPVGFVIDIDIEVTNRWNAVRGRLNGIGVTTPSACPAGGFFGQLPDYPHGFGVWLMPDCQSDGQMLENLLPSLMPAGDPLWPHAQSCTADAGRIVDEANAKIAGEGRRWKRFSDQVRIKAEVRCLLAWQREPGVALGAAINDRILDHDSSQALAFLRWLKQLYSFDQLTNV